MCECGACLVECSCGDWCCPYCGCHTDAIWDDDGRWDEE